MPDLDAVANSMDKLSRANSADPELQWNTIFWAARVRATQATIEKDADRRNALAELARTGFRTSVESAKAAASPDWSVFQVDWFGFETDKRKLQIAQQIVDAGLTEVRDDALVAALETIAREGPQDGEAERQISRIMRQAARSFPGKRNYLIARLSLLRARGILNLAGRFQSDEKSWKQLQLTQQLQSLNAPSQPLASVQAWAQGLPDAEVSRHFNGRSSLYQGMASFYLSLQQFTQNSAAMAKTSATAASTQLAASEELLREDASPEARLAHSEAIEWHSRVQTWLQHLSTGA
jgi:hypothetical protein